VLLPNSGTENLAADEFVHYGAEVVSWPIRAEAGAAEFRTRPKSLPPHLSTCLRRYPAASSFPPAVQLNPLGTRSDAHKDSNSDATRSEPPTLERVPGLRGPANRTGAGGASSRPYNSTPGSMKGCSFAEGPISTRLLVRVFAAGADQGQCLMPSRIFAVSAASLAHSAESIMSETLGRRWDKRSATIR